MIGPVKSYPCTGGSSGAYIYWFGELPENLQRLNQYNLLLFPRLAGFFFDGAHLGRFFLSFLFFFSSPPPPSSVRSIDYDSRGRLVRLVDKLRPGSLLAASFGHGGREIISHNNVAQYEQGALQ
jgi:hypothetical protein